MNNTTKKKTNQDDFVNQTILNMISPSGLEFDKSSLMVSENYSQLLSVTNYPTNPDFGWLSKITSIAGTTARVDFEPTDSSDLITNCNNQIRMDKADLPSVKDESERQRKEKSIEDISKMIRRVDEREIVGYINIILLVQATTQEKLEDRLKRVKSIISSFKGSTRVLLFKQREAYYCVSPYGVPKQTIFDMGQRNMPFSTFIGGFINASSGLNDGDGFLFGESERGKPIIINTWKRGEDRTNSNWFITGLPGVGKSSFVKDITLMEYATGAKLIFLDPEREYVDLVENLGGKVIGCGGGKGGRINPLQVRPAPNMDKDDPDEEEDPLFKDEGKGVSELAFHIQSLRIFHRIYKKGITQMQLDRLEEILEKTYERFGITWNTDVSKLKATEFPIYSDLYEDILREHEAHPDDKEVKELKTLFRSIAKGADANIFNGYSDIDFDCDAIDLDISSLLECDDNILRAQFHNINSYVWQKIAQNREEKIIYIVDEGYLIVDPENPQALIFIKNVSKRIRKYEGGLIFITHSVVDVLDESVKRHGQALIDNACFKFIMGTDGKNLEETKKLFHLTEAEDSLLLSKRRGKGLLFVGSVRLNAKIEISEKFLSLMGKAGGR